MGLLDQINEVLNVTPRRYWGEKANRLGSLLTDAASTGAEMYGSASGPLAPEHAQTLGGLLMDFSPLGDAKSAYDGIQSAREGDYIGAGLGALGALPMVPNLAGAVSPIGKLFHGSLDPLEGAIRAGKGSLGEGVYLTDRANQAALYPKLHAMKQGIKNPNVVVNEMQTSARNILNLDEMGGIPVGGIDVQKLKSMGYEGVTVNNELLVFDPNAVTKAK